MRTESISDDAVDAALDLYYDQMPVHGQMVNEDGSSGGKVRIYEGDLEETRHVTSTGANTLGIVIQDDVWEINPFMTTHVYVNTADSILREEDD